MILLHVVSKTETQAVENAAFLIPENLILHAWISKNATLREWNPAGNGMTSSPQVLLMGQTKALLFTMIDTALREKYPEELPIIYAVPIVGMDWEQADKMISGTAKVWSGIKVSIEEVFNL